MTATTPAYVLSLRCPRCGGLMHPVAQGVPTGLGRSISAVAECAGECRIKKQWLISARIDPLSQQELHLKPAVTDGP